LSKKDLKIKDRETGKLVSSAENLVKRHGGVLGICAIINASPYDTPDVVPDCVAHLCQFISDPSPIHVIVFNNL
jgi:proteasome activator subunit 4